MAEPSLTEAERAELANLFSAAITLDEIIAPVRNQGQVDWNDVWRPRHQLQELLTKIEPFLDRIPPAVRVELVKLAKIIKGTATKCVTLPDVVVYLAHNELSGPAWRGWRALTAAKPENANLYPWADENETPTIAPAAGRPAPIRCLVFQATAAGCGPKPIPTPQPTSTASLHWLCDELAQRLTKASHADMAAEALELIRAIADCAKELRLKTPVELLCWQRGAPVFIAEAVAHWVKIDNEQDKPVGYVQAYLFRFNDPVTTKRAERYVAGVLQDDQGQFDPLWDVNRLDKLRNAGVEYMTRWRRYLDAFGSPKPISEGYHGRTIKAGEALSRTMQTALESPEYQAASEAQRQAVTELAATLKQSMDESKDALAARHFDRPGTIEDWEHLARIVEMPAERIEAGSMTVGEIIDYAVAWADRHKIKAKLTAEAIGAGDSGNGTVEKAEASEENQQLDALTGTEEAILMAMLNANATGVDCRITGDAIAVKAIAKEADSNYTKKPLGSLKRCGLVQSKLGPSGGYWLTTEGEKRAAILAARHRK